SSPLAGSLTKSASIESVCGSVPVNSLVGPSFPLAGVCFQLEAAVIVYSVGLNENFTLMPSPGSLYSSEALMRGVLASVIDEALVDELDRLVRDALSVDAKGRTAPGARIHVEKVPLRDLLA